MRGGRRLADIVARQAGMLGVDRKIRVLTKGGGQPGRCAAAGRGVAGLAVVDGGMGGGQMAGLDHAAGPGPCQSLDDQPQRCRQRAAHRQLTAVFPAALGAAWRRQTGADSVCLWPVVAGPAVQRATGAAPAVAIPYRFALRACAAVPLGVWADGAAVAAAQAAANPLLVRSVVGAGLVVKPLQSFAHVQAPPNA